MSKLLIASLTTGALLIFAGIRVADFREWRAQSLNAAEARAANLSLILSEYIHEMFAAGDASLRQLAVHSRRIGGPEAPESEWMPSLTSAKAGLSGVGSISVVDANGTIRNSTQPVIVASRAAATAPSRACRPRPTTSWSSASRFSPCASRGSSSSPSRAG